MRRKNFGYKVQAIFGLFVLCCVLFITAGFGQTPVKKPENTSNLGSGNTSFTYENRTPITINDNSTASVYPSEITVGGINPASIVQISVRLIGFSHTFPDDVDILLVGPQGQRSIIMSDVGGSIGVNDLIFSFISGSPTIMPDNGPLTSGLYQPTNFGNPDNFPAPGPGSITQAADLSVFNGTNPNGVWKLHVVDDTGQDMGEITGDWVLEIIVNRDTATVTKTADTNDGVCDADCSLREAIASNANAINFSSLFNTPQTITLGGQLFINKSVKINGPGADNLTISGNNTHRVFEFAGASRIELFGATIRDGNGTGGSGGGIKNRSTSLVSITSSVFTGNTSDNGGGIFNETGADLLLANVEFSGNSATGSFGGGAIFNQTGAETNNVSSVTMSGNTTTKWGGGIYNNGTLNLTNLTISNGTADQSGGGIYNDFSGNITLTKTTISGNSAPEAGAIYNNSGGNLTLTNTTISNNSAQIAGGIRGTANSGNTIIAKNTAQVAPDFNGILNSNGYNLIGDTFSVTINGNTIGNKLNVDPMLAPLGDYGGPTQTHALFSGSPAIDAGNSFGAATDQRGFTRPIDISSVTNVSDGSDIGAFELQSLLIVNKIADTNDGTCDADCSLREAVAAAQNGNSIGFSSLFDSSQTITLTMGEIVIDKTLGIGGPGANLLTISGNNASRVFKISGGNNVSISGLTISDGNVSGFGGGITSQSNLTLTGVAVTGNQADSGGGVALGFANGTFTDCTFSGNSANINGGGINFQSNSTNTLQIINSTISGNTANSSGGGIVNFSFGSNGNTTLEVTNSTIVNNMASSNGGGIYTFTQNDPNATATTRLRNTIIANNTPNNLAEGTAAGGGPRIITSLGFNLSDNYNGLVTTQGSDITAQPMLAPLGNYGGPTQTHALLLGSPAIDKGKNGDPNITTDQRGTGFQRTFDDPNIPPASGGDNTDIGAFEAQSVLTPTPTLSISDVTANEGNSGFTEFTFRVSLSAASNQTVTFDAATADGTAISPADYIGGTLPGVSISPGQTFIDLTVEIIGDTDVEPDETLFVNISNPVNATIADGQGIGTILNDDSCSYTLSPASPQTVGAAQSSLNIAVTTTASCAWTAATSTSWITINSGSSGTGSGTVMLTFAANTGPARSGTLTIAGQTFTINQSGGCSYSVSPASSNVPNTSGSGSFILTTASGCNWTATSNANWLTVTSSSSGNGTATISYSFTANTGAARSGTINVGGQTHTVNQAAAPSGSAKFDFDGDGKSDVSVFRPSNGNWYLSQSTNGFAGITFGLNTDLLAPADFDGDGKTDIAVFRPSNGAWYYLQSSNNAFVGVTFGQNGDLPRPADFDGDGKADITVFRPSNGAWYRLNSSNGSFFGTIFGQNGDKPLIADFDGDGKADITVFRPANASFYSLDSSNGAFRASAFGLPTDIPTPGDFDGDGKTDVAVFRPSNGAWYRLNSSNGGFVGTIFGLNGDIPVSGDYDGDGKSDIAVFRPSNGAWYYLNSSNGGFVGLFFGLGTDKPVPAAFQ